MDQVERHVAQARMMRKVYGGGSEGRMLVVWSPEECQAMKDLLVRLERLEGVPDRQATIAQMMAYGD